jgi:hypothetical protein
MAFLYKQGYFSQLDLRSDVWFLRLRMDNRPRRYSTYVMCLVVDGNVVLEGRGIGKKGALRDLCLGVSKMVTEAVDRISQHDID